MPVNTATLKTFAPAMRRQLIEAVGRQLDLLLLSQTPDALTTYAKQIAELRQQEQSNRKDLLERVAYSWFNRLAALRYLDARGWHPFGCKVLMPETEGETQPELLKLMRSGSLPAELSEHTKESRLHGLLDGQIPTAIAGADPQGEVYRELVLATCRYYHQLLPNLFEALDDASELLLPDDLLTDGSIAAGFRSAISDEDCQDVEILGWLYQFYISEKKDEVMARKKAVPSEDIPAVTQLFTPHWIVRYLVENSLGRLWLRSRPNSGLKQHMPYYVDDPEGQTPTDSLTVASPEEIKLLDPACGSGHMLTYAFDLLVKIWEEDGHPPSEIPDKILTHNLYGLEICPRAAQLAQFALVCKAREQSRTAFRRPVQPQVMCLQNVVISPEEMQAWMRATGVQLSQEELTQIHQFRDNTETFGSLIQPVLDGEKLAALAARIGEQAPAGDLLVQNTHRKLRLVLAQAEMLSQRYQVVVANPPYMGLQSLGTTLKIFMKEDFSDFKSDLFAAFVARILDLVEQTGFVALMTPFTWMFIKTYESLRRKLIVENSIRSLIRPEYHAFFDSAFVPVCAFTVFRGKNDDKATFIDLGEFYGKDIQGPKALEAIQADTCDWKYCVSPAAFKKIPGMPIAYSVSETVFGLFESCESLGDKVEARQGLITANNERFMRRWWEPSTICFELPGSTAKSLESTKRWFPYNKGGDFRKWFGNGEFVVNWESDGIEIREFKDADGKQLSRPQNTQFYFRESVSWSDVTADLNAFRWYPEGFIFDATGHSAFPEQVTAQQLLAFLNTRLAQNIAKVLNPTMHFHVGYFRLMPAAILPDVDIRETVDFCITLARADWDNFETSWDFRDLPLLRPGDWEIEPGHAGSAWKGRTLAESWANYASYCTAAIRRMQELETENNSLWIDAYGLQDELDPAVPEDEITLARADARKDMAAFLSYAVGCMMGRYSLDQPGLILADAGDTVEHYLAKVCRPLDQVSFPPDEDAIIPVLDGEWFEDDIVARSREFLRVAFPHSKESENLRFVEESLGKEIRKYFCSDFYKDHLQTYKKRPIYWLVQSPKKGFSCLIYLHRYTKDTLNLVLNRYVQPYIKKLEDRLPKLDIEKMDESKSASQRAAARKEADKIAKVLRDCQDWERDALLPLAQQRIELDLDDGVKVNYLKLNGVLAPIPGLAAKGD
jgi:hypothetical protein